MRGPQRVLIRRDYGIPLELLCPHGDRTTCKTCAGPLGTRRSSARGDWRALCSVVFVRGDGYSIGALPSTEEAARALWADQWIAELRAPFGPVA